MDTGAQRPPLTTCEAASPAGAPTCREADGGESVNETVKTGCETEHASYYNLELADEDWRDLPSTRRNQRRGSARSLSHPPHRFVRAKERVGLLLRQVPIAAAWDHRLQICLEAVVAESWREA